MAEQQLRTLEEYSQSLEKESEALRAECRTLGRQLQSLTNEYNRLLEEHAFCHQELDRRSKQISMLEELRTRDQEAYRIAASFQNTTARQVEDQQKNTSAQPSSTYGISVGGLANIIQGRLQSVELDRADTMQQHIERVKEFRRFLAGTLDDIGTIKKINHETATRKAHTVSAEQSKPCLKDAMIQTDEPAVQQLNSVEPTKLTTSQPQTTGQLESHCLGHHQVLPNRGIGQEQLQSIKIEVHDTQDNLKFSTELQVIGDDSGEESVEVLSLEVTSSVVTKPPTNSHFINQIDQFQVRQEEITAKQNDYTRCSVLKGSSREVSLCNLQRELKSIISKISAVKSNQLVSELLRIAVRLSSKINEIQQINKSTFSQHLAPSNPILTKDSQKMSVSRQLIGRAEDNWRTSLEWLQDSKCRELSQDRWSVHHPKSRWNKSGESSDFQRNRVDLSRQSTTLLRQPNLSELAVRIRNLKHEHERRRRGHCIANQV